MLQTVNKSPFEKNAMQSCLRLSPQGSAVLFYEDGVYAAVKGTKFEAQIKEATQQFSVYALLPDLEARGMRADDVIDGIKTVDYSGFVDLVADNGTVQAWL